MQTADLADKQAAKAKRKEKREKRKAREAEEAADEDDWEGRQAVLVPFEGDTGTDLDALGSDRVKKRPKKWFEDDSDDERKSKRKRKGEDEVQEPESLEDLEAMAAGLLG